MQERRMRDRGERRESTRNQLDHYEELFSVPPSIESGPGSLCDHHDSDILGGVWMPGFGRGPERGPARGDGTQGRG